MGIKNLNGKNISKFLIPDVTSNNYMFFHLFSSLENICCCSTFFHHIPAQKQIVGNDSKYLNSLCSTTSSLAILHQSTGNQICVNFLLGNTCASPNLHTLYHLVIPPSFNKKDKDSVFSEVENWTCLYRKKDTLPYTIPMLDYMECRDVFNKGVSFPPSKIGPTNLVIIPFADTDFQSIYSEKTITISRLDYGS